MLNQKCIAFFSQNDKKKSGGDNPKIPNRAVPRRAPPAGAVSAARRIPALFQIFTKIQIKITQLKQFH